MVVRDEGERGLVEVVRDGWKEDQRMDIDDFFQSVSSAWWYDKVLSVDPSHTPIRWSVCTCTKPCYSQLFN